MPLAIGFCSKHADSNGCFFKWTDTLRKMRSIGALISDALSPSAAALFQRGSLPF
jgi:hypothetical protein